MIMANAGDKSAQTLRIAHVRAPDPENDRVALTAGSGGISITLQLSLSDWTQVITGEYTLERGEILKVKK